MGNVYGTGLQKGLGIDVLILEITDYAARMKVRDQQ
jgi:hypothetical protein